MNNTPSGNSEIREWGRWKNYSSSEVLGGGGQKLSKRQLSDAEILQFLMMESTT